MSEIETESGGEPQGNYTILNLKVPGPLYEHIIKVCQMRRMPLNEVVVELIGRNIPFAANAAKADLNMVKTK